MLDLDSSGKTINQSSVSYNVQAVVEGMKVISPAADGTVSTPTVHVVAHATETVPVGLMEVLGQ